MISDLIASMCAQSPYVPRVMALIVLMLTFTMNWPIVPVDMLRDGMVDLRLRKERDDLFEAGLLCCPVPRSR
jgi:hypothetical protein